MHLVGSCPSLFRACDAAAYLRAHGIPACASNASSGLGLVCQVFVLDGRLTAEARSLLREFDATKPDVDQGWEQGVVPDLSLLDPRFAPACPACDATLPLDSACVRCSACAATVDIIDLLLAAHGPELLQACYPQEPLEMSETQFQSLGCACTCGYNLGGLARIGVCPECGAGFDKAAILRTLRDSGLL